MPANTFRRLCLASFWIVVFIIAVIVATVNLYTSLPADCKVLGFNDITNTSQDARVALMFVRQDDSRDEKCMFEIEVEVSPKNDDKVFNATSQPLNGTCEKATEFKEDNPEGTVSDCWYNPESRDTVQYVTESNRRRLEADQARFLIVRVVTAIMAAFLGFCMVFSIAYMFREELLRWCPRFLLTMCMNLQAFIFRRDEPPEPPPAQGQDHVMQHITPPRTAAFRRRVLALVESTKLSEEEARALQREGWACCVCLEEHSETEEMRAISRLPCSHSTHSDCLQSWLEKGRGVCCLCNADVFAHDAKENQNSSPRTSTSGMDGGPPGSLEVERTEGAPSSLATSMFVEFAPTNTRATADSPTDDNDCPGETQS